MSFDRSLSGEDNVHGLQPAFNPFANIGIDPVFQELNSVFPQEPLPQDQNENHVAGQPATLDESFFTQVEDFLANISNPTPNVSEIPTLAEEESLETFFPINLPSCLADFEDIPTEVSVHNATQEKTSTVGLMDFESTWHLGVPSPQPHAFTDVPKVAPEDIVASYIVPPPQPKITCNNLQTSVYSPVGNSFSLPVNTDKGIPLVIEVSPILPYAPSRSQTVIKQGPALASRFPTRQIAPVSERSPPRGKKVAKTNAERCQVYRSNQKTRREQQDEELRMLDLKNRTLKAKEVALRNKVKKLKEAVFRTGLGYY